MDLSKRLELDRAEIFNNEDDTSDKNELELDNLLEQSNNADDNNDDAKLLVWLIGTSYYELVSESVLKKVEQLDRSKLQQKYNSNNYLRQLLHQYNEITCECNCAMRVNEKIVLRGEYMLKMLH